MSEQLLFFLIDAIAAFSVLLFGAHILFNNPKQLNARLLACICLNSACAIALNRQELGFWIPAAYQVDVGPFRLLFHIARNLTPGLLMVLCHSLFQDEPKFPRALWVALVVQIALEATLPLISGSGYPSQYNLLRAIPAALQLIFVGLSLFWLISGWRADLVEVRRRLRGIFLALVGTFTFVSVLLERLLIPWDSIATLYTHTAMALLQAILTNVALFITLRTAQPSYVDPFRDEKSPPTQLAPMQSPAVENHDAAIAAILKAFREQRVYRDGDLTIASLATRLAIPEYRLRKLIHEQLGYRNFNALLHDYRVAEACQEFSDRSKDHLPILTIALTAGYNSINPFNRAFRDLKGMTPSAFRAQIRQ